MIGLPCQRFPMKINRKGYIGISYKVKWLRMCSFGGKCFPRKYFPEFPMLGDGKHFLPENIFPSIRENMTKLAENDFRFWKAEIIFRQTPPSPLRSLAVAAHRLPPAVAAACHRQKIFSETFSYWLPNTGKLCSGKTFSKNTIFFTKRMELKLIQIQKV